MANLKVLNIFDCNTNTASIIVTWGFADSPYCGEVLYYIVTISSDEHSNNIMDNVTVLNAIFTNLTSDIKYNITVTAFNRAGAGMATVIVNLRTSSPVSLQST